MKISLSLVDTNILSLAETVLKYHNELLWSAEVTGVAVSYSVYAVYPLCSPSLQSVLKPNKD